MNFLSILHDVAGNSLGTPDPPLKDAEWLQPGQTVELQKIQEENVKGSEFFEFDVGGSDEMAVPVGPRVDTKLLTKPDKFSGKDEEWKDWKWGFMNYVGSVSVLYHRALKNVTKTVVIPEERGRSLTHRRVGPPVHL